jgi:NhaP-type Na+/H+ or K+/H+ antiporter
VPQRGVITGTVFGIVLFTLLVQGTTAARVIAWAGVERDPHPDTTAAETATTDA